MMNGHGAPTDVVVVGGGPAGSATASFLADLRPDAHILLLDRARFPRPKACAEYLSPGAVDILQHLGALQRLPAHVGRVLDGMRIYAPNGDSHLVTYRDPATGARRQGLALERWHLDAALLLGARERGVEVQEGVRVTAPLLESGQVRGVVVAEPGGRTREIKAGVVVGADGLHSVVVRNLNLARRVRWPRRLGLVAHLQGVPWPENFGQLHVGGRGYVGVAPLDGGGRDTVSVGLVSPMTATAFRLGNPAEAMMEMLRDDFPLVADRLSAGELLRPVQGAGPLAHAVRASAGAGYLLVGDAAGFLDPFTGEGIYRALRGAAIAAQFADLALQSTASWPELAAGYERERRRVFQAKENLTRIIQLFVHAPRLLEYALARLRRRQALAELLGDALGDLAPASTVLKPATMWGLLRP